MSPADIAAADLRAGLARRLAELGLVPPDRPIFLVSRQSDQATEPERKAA